MSRKMIVVLISFIVTSGDGAYGQPPKKTENVVKVTAKAAKPAADGTQLVTVTLAIDKGWHLYANPVGNDDLKSSQTTITITSADKPKVTKSEYPNGKKVKDALVGDYLVFEGTIDAKFTIKRAAGAHGPLEVAVKCQACNDKSCLLPGTIKITIDP